MRSHSLIRAIPLSMSLILLAAIIWDRFNQAAIVFNNRRVAHVTTPFDVLISDVVMEGMTGIDAAIQVRKVRPNCKVLLVSGNNRTADMLKDACERGHNFDILAKPAHPTVIIQAQGDVRCELMRGRRQQSECKAPVRPGLLYLQRKFQICGRPHIEKPPLAA
jgi:CheY-like chemotaxis protein